MQLISKCDKGICFLLCVIDIFGKYSWVVPLKDKKGVTIINAFQSILKDSKRKPNTIRVQDNNIEIYSTHNEGKSIVAEIFIRTLKSRVYKYMTAI